MDLNECLEYLKEVLSKGGPLAEVPSCPYSIEVRDSEIDMRSFSEGLARRLFFNFKYSRRFEIEKSVIHGDLVFNKLDFAERAVLRDVTINGDLELKDSHFRGGLSLINVNVHGNLIIGKRTRVREDLNLINVNVSGRVVFSFSSVVDDVRIVNLSYGTLDLEELFEELPSLRSSVKGSSLTSLLSLFTSVVRSLEGALTLMRLFQLECEKLREDVCADALFLLQQRLRRRLRVERQCPRGRLRCLAAKALSAAEYLLADLPSFYGTSWLRVIGLWIAMVGFAYPFLYSLCGCVTCSGKLSSLDPIYFSIITATTVGYGDCQPHGLLGKLLSSSEAVMGTYLWALLLTILTRKFFR